MWIVYFIIVMFSIKTVIVYHIFRELLNPKKDKPKRSVGEVRSKFKDVNEVRKFEEWREYIRVTLIRIEQDKILNDQDSKVYHSL